MDFSKIKPFVRFARQETITPYHVSANAVSGVDCRLIYILSEMAVFLVDGHEEHLKEGDMLIINSHTPYQAILGESPIDCFTLNFDFSFEHSDLAVPIGPNVKGDSSTSHLVIEHLTFDNCAFFNKYIAVRNAFWARNIIDKIMYEYSLKKNFYDLCISNLLSEILVKCARQHDYSSKLPSSVNHKTIDDILKYINTHYSEPLTNAELGSIFGFHANYIGYLIKSYTGISAHQYLLQIRMEKALSLLQTTTDSIENIAFSVGISSSAYFSRYFKKIYGISPSEYRKSYYI